ncbi:hypothetical protein L210DRAFT_3655262 [Boletus edulis BED1]|uniref:Uncharacterized protein n=1 Tax=Boletus edulis BED1 TaxID=1328754 RepID=A0AAD4BD90_BOLED|nr:hypothetical protein L210DRAFT_3655262 [Boletus edulis BED1]
MSSQTHPPSLPFPSPPALSTSSFVLEASNSPKSYRALLPRSKSTRLAPTWSTVYPPPIPNMASQEPAQYTV